MADSRAVSRQKWQALTDAQFTPEILAWVQSVATVLLVADDTLDDSGRRASIPAALGLAGHYRAAKGPTTTEVFDAAAKGRAQSRGMWGAISLGEFNRATLLWLANTAIDVLAADNENDRNTRRARLAEAVGLVGPFSADLEAVRTVARDADHITDLTLKKEGRQAAHGERARRRRQMVYASVKAAPPKTPEAVDAWIKRALDDSETPE